MNENNIILIFLNIEFSSLLKIPPFISIPHLLMNLPSVEMTFLMFSS